MDTKKEVMAEIVGLCFGDGSLIKRPNGQLRFQLRGNITEDREHYNSHILSLFDNFLGKVYVTEYKGENSYYGIYSENQVLCKTLESMGVPVGIKIVLEIPSWIKRNKKYLRRFLRGLIDTDGSVYCMKDYNYPAKGYIKIRLSINSVSLGLMNEINNIFNKAGILSFLIGPYKPKDRRCLPFNKVQIDGPNVVKYFTQIGSKNQKHITKYHIWKRFGFCPPYTSLLQRRKILKGSLNPYSLCGCVRVAK